MMTTGLRPEGAKANEEISWYQVEGYNPGFHEISGKLFSGLTLLFKAGLTYRGIRLRIFCVKLFRCPVPKKMLKWLKTE